MSKYDIYGKELLKKMSLEEKVAQLSQTVAGYRCYTRVGNNFYFTDELKKFVEDYGAMGAISNISRSCAWTKKDWGRNQTFGESYGVCYDVRSGT